VDCTALVMDGASCLSGPLKEGPAARVSSAYYAASLEAGSAASVSRVTLHAGIFTVMADNHPCTRRLVSAKTSKKCPARRRDQ
jgi:hypothetical protein